MIFGLERERFIGNDLFALETEKVFSKNWVCIGTVESWANDAAEANTSFRTFEIGGYSIVVVRNADSFVAFHNVCRHRGTRLLDCESGELKNDCLTCPYHAWTYGVDGSLIGAPNMLENPEFDRNEFGLISVGCAEWTGLIFVNLSVPSTQFKTDFSPILERTKNWPLESCVIGAKLEYDVRANWKIIFQNYSECYHCPTVHPNLNRLTPYKSATNDLVEGPILGGPMELADGFETISVDGKRIAEPFESLSQEQKRCVYYYTIFPNVFVSAHPDYVMIHQLIRKSDARTKVVCLFLVAEGVAHADLKRATDQWDEVNRQDWRVCELTQQGVESPAYQPGPYSNLESMLAAFDQHYLHTMNI